MCVAFLFLGDPDPDEDALKSPYVFVLAVNRDESYERPTQQMHFWPDRADVLAGRDEDAKGTWMGITRTGRVAVVTNYHEETPRHPPGTSPSRGELPVKFLDGDDAPLDFLRALAEDGGVVEKYNGFSLIVGDARTGEFACLSNRGDDAGTATPLAAKQSAECSDEDVGGAIYGLSNAALDAPWPKIKNGKKAMEEEMARVNRAWHVFGAKSEWSVVSPTVLLRDVLGNHAEFDRWDVEKDGEPPAMEASPSPFVRPGENAKWGTRTSTFYAVMRSRNIDERHGVETGDGDDDDDGGDGYGHEVKALEWTLDHDKKEWKDEFYAFLTSPTSERDVEKEG